MDSPRRKSSQAPKYQPKKYPEVDAFINSLNQQAWFRFIAAFTFSGNAGIVDLIRREYSEQFIKWGDGDLFHYLSERKLSDFLPARSRPSA